MRSCPVCGSPNAQTLEEGYAGFTSPPLNLMACAGCGFRYADAPEMTQAWFDDYYLHRYQTDDKPYSDERLANLANHVAALPAARLGVLDIGGTDGELISRLGQREITASASGVGEQDIIAFGVVVLSHTLEHIYDIDAMFQRIKGLLLPGGVLVVEGPIHGGEYLPVKDYDYRWQHINKFRMQDLISLFQVNGFEHREHRPLAPYREYCCWRITGKYV